MSDLKDNLNEAKREYRETRYHGDLATDVLGSPMRIGRWLPAVLAGAVAALLLVGLWPGSSSSVNVAETGEIAVRPDTSNTTDTVTSIDVVVALASEDSQDLNVDHDLETLAPSSEISLTPAMPDWPTMDVSLTPSMEDSQ